MSDTGKTFFVTGTNRGIGHELVRQILANNPSNKVIASIRDDSNVNELFITKDPRLTILKLDLEDPSSFKSLQNELEKLDIGIDVFISNAALNTAKNDVLNTSSEEYVKFFIVNTIGPIETLKVLKPFLLKKKTRKIILTTSVMGSIGDFPYFLSKAYPSASYSLSKAGLNLLGKELSYELAEDGFIVVNYTPGLINTSDRRKTESNDDIAVSRGYKPDLELIEYATNNTLSIEEGVKRELQLIEGFTIKDSGKFYNHDGLEIKY